jgi:hypothetical protein
MQLSCFLLMWNAAVLINNEPKVIRPDGVAVIVVLASVANSRILGRRSGVCNYTIGTFSFVVAFGSNHDVLPTLSVFIFC